jgi:hypothetical protein
MQNLDEYIEHDIVGFLELKTKSMAKKGLVRDEELNLYSAKQREYEKEIEDSLKEENITKAKVIFDELKNEYLSTNNNTHKKKLLKTMELVHKRIKHHIEKKESEAKSFEETKLQHNEPEPVSAYESVQNKIEPENPQELTVKNYISGQLSKGKSKDEIKKSLIGVGWPVQTIEKYLN